MSPACDPEHAVAGGSALAMTDHVGSSSNTRPSLGRRLVARVRATQHPAMWVTALVISLFLTTWIIARPGDEQTYQRVCAAIVLVSHTLATGWAIRSLRRREASAEPAGAEHKRIWRARLYLTLAVASFGFGQYVWYFYELVAQTPPFPSAADAAYLLLYPFLIAGTLLLAPDGLLKRGRVLLDSLTSIAAVSVFAWYFLVGPTISASDTGILAKLLGAGYPLGDIVVLFCLLTVVATLDPQRSIAVAVALSAGVLMLVTADVAFLYRQLQQTYVSGTILDVLWPTGCMLLGIAANQIRSTAGAAGAIPGPAGSINIDARDLPPAAMPLWRSILPELLVLPVVVLAAHAQYADVPRSMRLATGLGAVIAATLVLVRKALAARDGARLYDSLRVAFTELAAGHQSLARVNEELRRNEERFQIAVRATKDSIYDWDIRADRLWWNSSFYSTFGFEPSEVGEGIAWWVSQLHPDDAAPVKASLDRAIAGGQHFWSAEYRHRRRDGSYAHLFERGYILRDEDGRPVRMIGALTDVTQRHRKEAELQRARFAAEDASRTKSEFLANMSHEIRTPMTAILGYTDLLLEPNQPEDARVRCVETIQRNGRHLLTIINDILDLSKIEAGKLAVERSAVSPVQVVQDSVALVRAAAIEKGLDVRVQYDDVLPAQVRTDATRLRQVLVNLLGNAIKFTDRGSVRLRVGLGTRDGRRLRFTIIDTGIGMAAEQQARLFQPFTQMDGSSTRRFGGTGLGLTISRRLAQLLGGDITVRSAPGVGSEFTVVIDPGDLGGVAMVRPTDAPAANAVAANPEAPEVTLRARVLVAEDGEDNQALIQHYLSRAGAEVTVVENGQAAVEAVADAARAGLPYDIVLMDMQMPVLDGYAATGRLRGQGFAGAVIALTAHAMEGDRERCIEAGCDAFVAKPIDRGAMMETVRAHVGKRRTVRPAA